VASIEKNSAVKWLNQEWLALVYIHEHVTGGFPLLSQPSRQGH